MYCIIGLVLSGAVIAATDHASVGNGIGARVLAKATDEASAWQAVLDLASKKLDKQKLQADAAANEDLLSQAEQFVEAANAAKQFQAAYPASKMVGKAKKSEVKFRILAVQAGANEIKQDALAAGDIFVGDKSNDRDDRLDIAYAMQAVRYGADLADKDAKVVMSAKQKMADEMQDAFGYTDAVNGMYLTLIRDSDSLTAYQISSRLLTSKQLPDFLVLEAKSAIEQYGFIGKAFPVSLTDVDGKTVDLANASNKRTVVYFWSGGADTFDLSVLQAIQTSLGYDARWVYVKIAGAAKPSDAELGMISKSGTQCVIPEGFGGAVPVKVKILSTPYAYVLDSSGKVLGYGTPGKIAGMLGAATSN